MEKFSMYQFLRNFNRGDFRRKSISQELVTGWPAIERIGSMICVTIPYYAKQRGEGRYYLMPIYCSVKVPLLNPERIVDFTNYSLYGDWNDVDFQKPAAAFPHKALADVKSKDEYNAMCKQLYSYYDEMIEAISQKKPFANEKKMIELFSKLMEPGLYPYYKRINKKFYTYFCRL